MITIISDRSPVCYGICCPVHGTCKRYQNLDNARHGVPVIANCSNFEDNKHPLYLEVSKDVPN